MNFVIHMTDGSEQTFSGDAECWREGGVLSVQDGERHIVYSPSGWARIEADKEIFAAATQVEGSVTVEGAISTYG